MNIVMPMQVDDNNLDESNVANEYDDWTAGSYSAGDKRVFETYVYEALTTTSEQPDEGAALGTPTWARLGRANKWRMWYDGSDSLSTAPEGEDLDVTITLDEPIGTVGIMAPEGLTARVIMTDPVEGVVFDQSQDITDIGAGDLWEFFFLPYTPVGALIFEDVPAYADVELRIIIEVASGTSVAKCGRVIVGTGFDPGVTLEDTEIRIDDFGLRKRDSFGNLELKPVRTIRLIDYEVLIEAEAVDATIRTFQSLSSIATLYIGHAELPESIAFGVYESFSTITKGYDGAVTRAVFTVEEF